MRMFFAGDVVLNDDTYGSRIVDDEIFDIIKQQDVVCCNLEGCIDKENLKPAKKRGSYIKNGIYTPQRLKESGFNMVTLANNHIMDYGVEGLANTLDCMKEEFYCLGAGTDESSIYSLQKISVGGGVTVGLISVGEKQFGASLEKNVGFAWMLHRNTWKLLCQAKNECDYTIVICHAGAEHLCVPLPEIRELYRTFIDCGATVVIGHHPHVIQGWEEYKGKRIYYSLGNLAFERPGSKTPYNPIGMCLCIEITHVGLAFHSFVTEYKNGVISIKHGSDYLEQVNEALESEKQYNKLVEEHCVNLYLNYFRRYYGFVLGLDINNQEKMKLFANHRLNDDEIRWDDVFLYHNIAIETNRWICERAIRILGYLE